MTRPLAQPAHRFSLPRRTASLSSFLVAAIVLGSIFGSSSAALAGPRVGVVVVSHEGITDDQADEIAYDVAGALATQIEGEALAGQSIRDLLTDGIPPNCEEEPVCGRKIGAALKTDEVLFLVMKPGMKKEVDIACHRIARDPNHVASDVELVLAGPRAKREKAVTNVVASLYPTGSVVVYVEPPPPPPAPPPAIVAPPPPPKPVVETTPVTKKWWFWTATAGGVLVLTGAIIGIAFAAQPGPSAPSLTLPP